MIRHNDDAFATMLLTCQITPDREELSRPLSPSEWHALKRQIHEYGLSMGALLGMDMSGFMMKFGMTEAEAYRLCLLLGRVLPLSVALDKYAERGIDVAAIEERAYPQRLRERLGVKAPPVIYLSGRPEMFMQEAVAILGNLPARGECEAFTRALVRMAVSSGYVILTDGQQGASRIAGDEAAACGGRFIELSAQALSARVAQDDMKKAIDAREAACLSFTHPDAPFTAAHAIARNKYVYAMASAAFVVSADARRGATWDGAAEALRNRYCDFIYVWDTGEYPQNIQLCANGASALRGVDEAAFAQMARSWRGAEARQMSMFE